MIPVVEVEAILINSSTGDVLLVDTSSGSLAIRIVGAEGLGVTTKDESSKYGEGVRSLDVNVKSGIVQVQLTGENLRYEEMTKAQSIANGSYTTVYNNTSTGKVIWARLVVSNNDVNAKITVDDNIILNGFHLQELYKDYNLDTSDPGVSGMDFVHTEKQGKVLVLNFPGGMEFDDYFKVELKANQSGVTMNRGLVVRAQG